MSEPSSQISCAHRANLEYNFTQQDTIHATIGAYSTSTLWRYKCAQWLLEESDLQIYPSGSSLPSYQTSYHCPGAEKMSTLVLTHVVQLMLHDIAGMCVE